MRGFRQDPFTAPPFASLIRAITIVLSIHTVRGDLPDVCPGIPDHRAPITVRRIRRHLDRFSACRDRPPVGLIRVLNVDIEKGRHRLAAASAVADQDDRVSDPNFRWRSGPNFTLRIENVSQESGQAGEVARDNSRYDGRPAGGLELGHGSVFLPEPRRTRRRLER